MNKKQQIAKYIGSDAIAAALAWSLLYFYRKIYMEPGFSGRLTDIQIDQNYWLALAVIPTMWIVFYYISGFYSDIFRRSRLIDLGQTILSTLIGVTVIFFTLLLDDSITTYKNYYQLFFSLLLFHFILTYIPRLVL